MRLLINSRSPIIETLEELRVEELLADVASAVLLGELSATRPLSITRQEDIAALRAWARDRAADAD